MNNQFFLDAGIPPLLNYNQPPMPTWHPLPPADVYFPAPATADGFFDSALSSMVSSPASAISNERFAIRELIGKFGNICNSGEISPPANAPAPYVSVNNYCYNTPLSSPPKADFFAHPGNPIGSNLPAMPGDSGFAERAARFSSFRSRSFNCRTSQFGYPNVSGFPPNAPTQSKPGRKLQRVLSSPSLKMENENDMKVDRFSGNCGVDQGKIGNSRENSSVSEQTHPGSETGSRPGLASRKRKSAPKAKSKQIPSSSPVQETQNKNDPIAKRIKSSEGKEDNNNTTNEKDYIHVRSRRGQATDSHSLAERVRREKISERMKLLQDIVPGCNKVTGKALMLEEIINYVQSLQRQVEFLSMKLASTPPSTDFDTSNPFQNDIFQPNCSLQTSSMHRLDALSSQNIYGAQNGSGVCPLDQSHEMQLPPSDGFVNGVHELQSLCEGDLHTIVEMGFSDNRLYTG